MASNTCGKYPIPAVGEAQAAGFQLGRRKFSQFPIPFDLRVWRVGEEQVNRIVVEPFPQR
jgi:hypothetical protein